MRGEMSSKGTCGVESPLPPISTQCQHFDWIYMFEMSRVGNRQLSHMIHPQHLLGLLGLNTGGIIDELCGFRRFDPACHARGP